MARRKKKSREFPLDLADLRGLVEGDDVRGAFSRIKKHLTYDDKGNNLLMAYLHKTANMLKRLPDSEVGDLKSEADKQILHCATKYVQYQNDGKESKIAFKTYYYNRLKQCFTDRKAQTVKAKDKLNTHASSLSKMVDEDGYDVRSSEDEDIVLSIAVRQRLEKLPKREKMYASKIMEGSTLKEIQKEMEETLMSRNQDRDQNTVSKFVAKATRDSMKVIEEAFKDMRGMFV